MVSDGDARAEWIAAATADDRAWVDDVTAEMDRNFEFWEAKLEQLQSTIFEADLGDVSAACTSRGELVEFALAPDVMSTYTVLELQARINAVLSQLRAAVIEEFNIYEGGGFLE